MEVVYYEGVGRRKAATARVRLYPGEGSIVVNDKPMEEYFSREGDVLVLIEPLKVTGTVG
jgi:small subunit ribosomal protein S9